MISGMFQNICFLSGKGNENSLQNKIDQEYIIYFLKTTNIISLDFTNIKPSSALEVQIANHLRIKYSEIC